MPVIDSVPPMGQSGTAGPKPTEWYETIALDGTAGYALAVPPGTARFRTDPTNALAQLPVYKLKSTGVNNDWAGLGCIAETIPYTAFTDGGSTSGTYAMKMTIPAGAFVVQTLLQDVTGFTGDTSAVVIVGDGTDTDRYNTGTPSLFTTAVAIAAGVPSGTKEHLTEKTVTVTVTSASDWGLVTAGKVTVKIYFYR